jgi:predicted DNA-binding protein (MmcQ/YjbR family)
MSKNSLIEFCRTLPSVTEDVKWENNLCFLIGGKIFAIFNLDNPSNFSFKTTPEMFSTLIGVVGIIPAPYLARFNWIAVQKPKALPMKMLKGLIAESYELIAAGLPASVRKKLARSKSSLETFIR